VTRHQEQLQIQFLVERKEAGDEPLNILRQAIVGGYTLLVNEIIRDDSSIGRQRPTPPPASSEPSEDNSSAPNGNESPNDDAKSPEEPTSNSTSISSVESIASEDISEEALIEHEFEEEVAEENSMDSTDTSQEDDFFEDLEGLHLQDGHTEEEYWQELERYGIEPRNAYEKTLSPKMLRSKHEQERLYNESRPNKLPPQPGDDDWIEPRDEKEATYYTQYDLREKRAMEEKHLAAAEEWARKNRSQYQPVVQEESEQEESLGSLVQEEGTSIVEGFVSTLASAWRAT
jgi:hypothetical protein